MTKSAIVTSLTTVALLLFVLQLDACGPLESGEHSAKAEYAWALYKSKPSAMSYENFIVANRNAADKHGRPLDAIGIEYQARALEVMAAEAERASDIRLADDVTTRVDELAKHDTLDIYEEAHPGSKERLLEARKRAAAVIR